jgi:hypothetical protein
MTDYIYNFYAPLTNFHSDESEIVFNKNLKIGPATEGDLKALKDLQQRWTSISSSETLLQVKLVKTQPESEPDIYLQDARKEIEKVVTLLRLYKEESVGFNLIVQRYSDGPHYALSANALLHYMLWTPPKSELLNRSYGLIGDSAQGFKSFFTGHNLPSLSIIDMALSYFNKSYIEPYPFRDGFIDCIIALENLFLKDTSQELGYKLRIRIAHLLGQNTDHRKELFEFIKEAYSLRSTIVHGEKSQKLKKLNDIYLLKTRKILRESIKYVLKNPNVWSGDKLDGIVLNGTYFPNHSVE